MRAVLYGATGLSGQPVMLHVGLACGRREAEMVLDVLKASLHRTCYMRPCPLSSADNLF